MCIPFSECIYNCKFYKQAMSILESIPDKHGKPVYKVAAKLLYNVDNGLASLRTRVYIIGYKRYKKVKDFEWPRALPQVNIESILDTSLPSCLPTTKTSLECLEHILTDVEKAGHNPSTDFIICDVHQSLKFGLNWQLDISPTLTRTRAGSNGFFITNLERMMTTDEMLALQGFPKGRLTWQNLRTDQNRKVTNRQFNLMIGNTMAVPVIGRVILELFKTIGILPANARDPWAMQSRMRHLT